MFDERLPLPAASCFYLLEVDAWRRKKGRSNRNRHFFDSSWEMWENT